LSVSAKRAAAILKAARGKEIVVVGDLMLDEFVWGTVSRISPEAPVPVVEVSGRSFHLGGAANVAHNLHSLGGEPLLVGVLGEDEAASRLRSVLGEVGISGVGLLTDPSRPTTLKTRIIAHGQQVVRADHESKSDIPRSLEDRALEKIGAALERASALVLSDYSKGTFTKRIVSESARLARKRKLPILVDPKVARFDSYRGVSLVTPNIHETERIAGKPISDAPALAEAAKSILKKLRCQAVLVTRGELGMSLFEKGKPPVHIGATAREVFDVTGAGDTVIATIALSLSGGGSLTEAAHLANRAAGIVVGKLGTAAVDPQALLDSISDGSGGRR